MMIKIVAPIMPVTWSRPRFDSDTRNVFNTKRYANFKDELGVFARLAMRGRPLITGEVKLYAEFYRRKPKPRKDKPQVSFIGDVDRYLNAVLDSLIGICYEDDRQVTDIHGKKIFGNPHILIELEEVKGESK